MFKQFLCYTKPYIIGIKNTIANSDYDKEAN